MSYLHLGKGKLVNVDEIIGIFDLDITSQSRITRAYLAAAEKAGEVVNAAEDIPKAFVVCADGKKRTLYLSQMAAATLANRLRETQY